MKIRALGSLILAFSLTFSAHTAEGKGTIGPRLKEAIALSSAPTIHHAWVYLTDKGTADLQKAAPASLVTESSLRRRMNVLPATALVDETDLPVQTQYVLALGQTGATVQQVSKWLNAVSVRGTEEQIARCAALPFVKNIELVSHFRRSPVPPRPRRSFLLCQRPPGHIRSIMAPVSLR